MNMHTRRPGCDMHLMHGELAESAGRSEQAGCRQHRQTASRACVAAPADAANASHAAASSSGAFPAVLLGLLRCTPLASELSERLRT